MNLLHTPITPANVEHPGIASASEFSGDSTSRRERAGGYTAVIDIGSGSARAVVMQVNSGGGVEVVAQQRVNLNLMSHLDANGLLDEQGVTDTVDAIEDFALLARGFGIQTIHAVATAAVRESGNANAITDTAAERFGIPLRIIGGDEEAAYCFLGAVHGLPVTDGIMADIGGGSTEIVEFGGRALQKATTLPLGSLRIANQFGLTDRPDPEDAAAAYEHVYDVLAGAGVGKLPRQGALVGSGGSVRLLARLVRSRTPYPISRMHGYEIHAEQLATLAETLSAASRAQREEMRGMNPERSHSIVGGALVARALTQYVAADSILVSGQGLREGLARNPGTLSVSDAIRLPSPNSVRAASLVELAERFAPRFSSRGQRRAALAGKIAVNAWGGQFAQLVGSLQCAALLLDIGNAFDYYNRLNRTASIITSTDLPGFTHRDAAQIAAILLVAERKQLPSRFRRSGLLSRRDQKRVGQAAAALLVADALERRLPLGLSADAVEVCWENDRFTVRTPAWSRTADAEVANVWAREFGEGIEILRGAL